MDILVTIAIASYNNSLYIERCIESVISQSYNNLEILIVDDGSTDDTISRINKYTSDDRIRIISKENGGLSSVRQMCLENAKGDYISFIDADDYLAINYVEKMAEKLLKDKTDICVCSTRFVDEKGEFMKKETDILTCDGSKTSLNVNYADFASPNEHFSDQFFLSDSWNKMYKTAFILKTGVGFNMPKGLNGTDTVFNRRLFLHLPSYSFEQEQLYIHVVYNSSAAHRKHKDLMSTTFFIVGQLQKEVELIKQEQYLQKRLSSFYYRGLLSAFRDVNLEKGLRKNELKEMLTRHNDYLRSNPYITMKICEIKSYELKSFLIVLKCFPLLLPLYFKAHSIVIG